MPEANSGVLLLEVDATATCTAALLSNQWATTAAHCLSGVGPTYTLKMNGATSGYHRPIFFSGDTATLVGQDLSCYGYGANT